MCVLTIVLSSFLQFDYYYFQKFVFREIVWKQTFGVENKLSNLALGAFGEQDWRMSE